MRSMSIRMLPSLKTRMSGRAVKPVASLLFSCLAFGILCSSHLSASADPMPEETATRALKTSSVQAEGKIGGRAPKASGVQAQDEMGTGVPIGGGPLAQGSSDESDSQSPRFFLRRDRAAYASSIPPNISDCVVFQTDVQGLELQARQGGHIRIALGGRQFDLALSPNNLWRSGLKAMINDETGLHEVDVTRPEVYKGTVDQDPEGRVRLTFGGAVSCTRTACGIS
jgi:hypothetical protein